MGQKDMVRNMTKSGPCACVATLIAEFPDGADSIASRAECIQTKFCPEGKKRDNERQGSLPVLASGMRALESALRSEIPDLYHGSFHANRLCRCHAVQQNCGTSTDCEPLRFPASCGQDIWLNNYRRKGPGVGQWTLARQKVFLVREPNMTLTWTVHLYPYQKTESSCLAHPTSDPSRTLT